MENFFKELRTFFGFTQDELAKKLSLESGKSISMFESNSSYPPLNSLIKLSGIYGLSIDFLILNNGCNYPRNIKLLSLAKEFDSSAQYQSRSHVEASAQVFLKDKNSEEIKQDSLEIELGYDFRSNLKTIRTFRQKSQLELAEYLGVGRTAITLYEQKNFPAVENLIKISAFFDVSMHALLTGQKLNYQFTDGHFGKAMLLADRLLPLEKQKYLVELMEGISRS
jgi:transcriptional regulator with XRE-family HTH domain